MYVLLLIVIVRKRNNLNVKILCINSYLTVNTYKSPLGIAMCFTHMRPQCNKIKNGLGSKQIISVLIVLITNNISLYI